MSSIIHPLHKPLLRVKVEIDSIDLGFGIGNGLEGARLMRTAEILYQRDIPFIPCPGRFTPPVSAVSPGASLCKNLASLIEESDKHGLGIFQFHAGWYRRPKPPQGRMRKSGTAALLSRPPLIVQYRRPSDPNSGLSTWCTPVTSVRATSR